MAPCISAVSPVLPMPVCTSRPRARSSAAMAAAVAFSWNDSSGMAWYLRLVDTRYGTRSVMESEMFSFTWACRACAEFGFLWAAQDSIAGVADVPLALVLVRVMVVAPAGSVVGGLSAARLAGVSAAAAGVPEFECHVPDEQPNPNAPWGRV